jgi:hypothetical protein
MNRLTFTNGVVAITLRSVGQAFGQQPKADCRAPEKVEGQVLRVDPKTDKVVIRDSQGTTHEFQSNKETTKDLKPGDRIEARLRQTPKC